MNKHFSDIEELQQLMEEKQSGHILIGYQKVRDYDGMVLGIGIIFNTTKSHYELDLQWVSFGLDLYGENLLENYLYRFISLEALLNYLYDSYKLSVTDIPVKYQIDPDQFPNPIRDAERKPQFEEAWQRFQQDFRKGIFLDESLELVYSSV